MQPWGQRSQERGGHVPAQPLALPPGWRWVSTEPAEWPEPRLEQPMGRPEGMGPASRTPLHTLPCGPRRCGHRTRGPRPSCWHVRPGTVSGAVVAVLGRVTSGQGCGWGEVATARARGGQREGQGLLGLFSGTDAGGSRQEDWAGPAPGTGQVPSGLGVLPSALESERQALVSRSCGHGPGAAAAPSAPSQTCGHHGPASPRSQCSHLQSGGPLGPFGV